MSSKARNTDDEIDDLEESNEVLDFAEIRPVDFWEKRQRELVTSSVDYNLETLSNLVENRVVDLKPSYQRRFRWDDKRQSKLIESFLMNVPVPPIFLNEDAYGKYSVIDGKQRLTAIHQFMRGRLTLKGLEVFGDINDKTYDDLPKTLQNVIKTRPTLRAIIVLRQSDKEVKFEVFQRLNTGGVRLNPQEIRNSTYPGPLNDLILELSECTQFHKILGITNKAKSRIYQEMRDAELVLRFLTFRDKWDTFEGGIKRHLDDYMSDNQIGRKKSFLVKVKDEFLSTLEIVEACFSDHAFHRWMPDRQQWRRHVLASLFDAQMLGCMGLDKARCKRESAEIISRFKKLFDVPEFRKSIDSATNTPSFFRYRITAVRDLVRSIV